MKKILNSIMLLLLAGTSALMVSCKDDDNNASGDTNRQFMTMFICDNTRGKGSDYPYNSGPFTSTGMASRTVPAIRSRWPCSPR